MNLQNHFLIAMPLLQDPFFKRSVVYICEHNEDGAMGLIINKPLENLTVYGILKKLNIPIEGYDHSVNILNQPVFSGGPLAEDRGFILHSDQYTYTSSIRISNTTIITTSRDILEAIGTITQPNDILVALGYCAWKKNQLENELLKNTWLTTQADNTILFKTPISERWCAAAKSIGVNIHQMTSDAGHA